MATMWLQSAIWLGHAPAASIISIRFALSVALVEIIVGAIAGNAIGVDLTERVDVLAGFGAILQTFLTGSDIGSEVARRRFAPSIGIGAAGILARCPGIRVYARCALGWSWPQAQIGGIPRIASAVAPTLIAQRWVQPKRAVPDETIVRPGEAATGPG